MKKQIAILALQMTILATAQAQPSLTAKKMSGSSLYGSINLGYSNYGLSGEASLSYRVGNNFLSLGYYKSHVCYHGYYDGWFLWNAGSCEHHVTIQSYSVNGGILLPGRLTPSISCGISLTNFNEKLTEPVSHNFGLEAFVEVASGAGDYHDVITETSTYTIGIPVAFQVHLLKTSRFGIDAGVKVDLNPQKTFASVMLGVRQGRMMRRR